MADWTLSSGSICRPVRSALGSPQVRHFQASTAATTAIIVRGDIVHFDYTADTNAFRLRRDLIASTTPSTAIVGVAGRTDTSDGSTTGLPGSSIVDGARNRYLEVYLADPANTEFQANFVGTAASTLLGTDRAISRDSTLNIWTVRDAGQVGNSTISDRRVTITDVPFPGDTNAPVYFKFMRARPTQDSTVSTSASRYLALGQ